MKEVVYERTSPTDKRFIYGLIVEEIIATLVMSQVVRKSLP